MNELGNLSPIERNSRCGLESIQTNVEPTSGFCSISSFASISDNCNSVTPSSVVSAFSNCEYESSLKKRLRGYCKGKECTVDHALEYSSRLRPTPPKRKKPTLRSVSSSSSERENNLTQSRIKRKTDIFLSACSQATINNSDFEKDTELHKIESEKPLSVETSSPSIVDSVYSSSNEEDSSLPEFDSDLQRNAHRLSVETHEHIQWQNDQYFDSDAYLLKNTPYFYAYTAAYDYLPIEKNLLPSKKGKIESYNCDYPIMSRPTTSGNGQALSAEPSAEIYTIPSKPINPSKISKSQSLPFTRSQCLGVAYCKAGCVMHSKKRRRSGLKKISSIDSASMEETSHRVFQNGHLNHFSEDEGIFDDDDVNEEVSFVRYIRNCVIRRLHRIKGTTKAHFNRGEEEEEEYKDEEDNSEEEKDQNESSCGLSHDIEPRVDFSKKRCSKKSNSFHLRPLLLIFLMISAALIYYSMKYSNFVQTSILPQSPSFSPFLCPSQTCSCPSDSCGSYDFSAEKALFDNKIAQIQDNFDKRLTQLETLYSKLTNELNQVSNQILSNHHEMETSSKLLMRSDLDINQVEKLIKRAIDKYNADKTGLVDWALESSGAEVVNIRCSNTFDQFGIHYKLFGMPVWRAVSSPRAVIQPNMAPGECWAFVGAKGYIVIKLAHRIRPTSFTYEHIPVQISRDGNLNSAPREFEVRSLQDEDDIEGQLLGRYEFAKNGDPLQQFIVQHENPKPTKYIELIVHSNHDNPEYTCLYRFRVHGERL